MFAFALWDNRTQELYLVRDRMGIKPLYYTTCDGKLSFASEIKALLMDPKQERKVNEDALFHYLSFLTTPAPMTLFNGIQKLANATYLKVGKDGTQEIIRYYDPLTEAENINLDSEEEYATLVQNTLRESVNLRKMADVPVGTFLSEELTLPQLPPFLLRTHNRELLKVFVWDMKVKTKATVMNFHTHIWWRNKHKPTILTFVFPSKHC